MANAALPAAPDPVPCRIPSRPGIVARLVRSLLPVAVGLGVAAAPVTFTVDPARSSVAMGGTVSALGQTAPLQPQGPGALSARYSGTLPVELGEGTLRFVPGGTLVPAQELAWAPGPAGVEGSAPASYGAKATLMIFGIFPANAVSASRALVFETVSPDLTLAGGAFPLADLSVRFLEAGASAVDYRVTGNLSLEGTRVLAGVLTNRVGAAGTLATAGDVQTLTLPVDADYSFTIEGELGVATFNLRFEGQIVATRTVESDPGPVVVFAPPAAAGDPLVLTFDQTRFRLQRATRLDPADWADVETPSPVTVVPEGPGAFYRVVPR